MRRPGYEIHGCIFGPTGVIGFMPGVGVLAVTNDPWTRLANAVTDDGENVLAISFGYATFSRWAASRAA